MDDLTKYLRIFKRHWLPALIVFLTFLGLAAFYTSRQKPVYQATGKVQFKKTTKASSLILPGIGNLDSAAGTLPAYTQVELIKSIPIAQQTIAALKLPDAPEELLKKVNVEPVKNTDILEVSYRDSNARLTAQVVQYVMEAYVKKDLETQRTEAKTARQFIEAQLPQIEARVRNNSNSLRQFKEQNQVFDLGVEGNTLTQTINNLKQEISKDYAQLAAAQSRVNDLRKLFGEDVDSTIRSGIISESPTLQKSLNDLKDIQQKLALESTRLTDANPIIFDLKNKRDNLQRLINEEYQRSLINGEQFKGKVVQLQQSGIQKNLIEEFARVEAQRTSLEKQITALTTVVNSYEQRISDLPRLEQQQRQLEGQLKADQVSLDGLRAKLSEIKLSENQTIGNARIDSPALVPLKPIEPKPLFNLGAGAIIGLLFGGVTALVLDGLDRRIKTVEAAKQIFNYPVLGAIPPFGKIEHKFKTPARIEVLLDGTTIPQLQGAEHTESFQMLQANLRFTNTENSGQAVVISSSMGKEGKSTIAANLARVTAQLGKRVLLIDADMREPSQDIIWQVNNDIGLSTILTAQSQFLESVVEVAPNLELLPSGIVPPNPMMLLDSSTMTRLVSQCTQLYDLVIIDSPPLTVAADATLLAKISSGLVMVVRPTVASKGSLNYAQEILQQSGQKVLGMVLNEVPAEDNLNAFGNNRRNTPRIGVVANPNLLPESDIDDV